MDAICLTKATLSAVSLAFVAEVDSPAAAGVGAAGGGTIEPARTKSTDGRYPVPNVCAAENIGLKIPVSGKKRFLKKGTSPTNMPNSDARIGGLKTLVARTFNLSAIVLVPDDEGARMAGTHSQNSGDHPNR